MEAPQHIQDGLRDIREGLHLRWNPRAVLLDPGKIDAFGKNSEPTYDPRFELWDTTPDGLEYMVMRVQDPEGEFRYPGEWLLEHIWKLHPARYNNDINKLVLAQLDDPDTLREIGTKKDSDDLIDAVANWAAWVATPKSAAGLANRGKRILSY